MTVRPKRQNAAEWGSDMELVSRLLLRPGEAVCAYPDSGFFDTFRELERVGVRKGWALPLSAVEVCNRLRQLDSAPSERKRILLLREWKWTRPRCRPQGIDLERRCEIMDAVVAYKRKGLSPAQVVAELRSSDVVYGCNSHLYELVAQVHPARQPCQPIPYSESPPVSARHKPRSRFVAVYGDAPRPSKG